MRASGRSTGQVPGWMLPPGRRAWPPPAPHHPPSHPCLTLCASLPPSRNLDSIPADYLVGTKRYVGLTHAETPLIVFINAKSGGRVGPRLLSVLFRALGTAQVVSSCAAVALRAHACCAAARLQAAAAAEERPRVLAALFDLPCPAPTLAAPTPPHPPTNPV